MTDIISQINDNDLSVNLTVISFSKNEKALTNWYKNVVEYPFLDDSNDKLSYFSLIKDSNKEFYEKFGFGKSFAKSWDIGDGIYIFL